MDETQSSVETTTQSAGQTPQKAGFGLLGHFIAFLVCVGFPAFVSLIAPVSWVTLERNGESVSARAKVCVFFVIPFRSLSVTSVTAVETRSYQAPASSSGTNSRKTAPDPEDFLVFRGDGDQKIEVPVSAFNVESVRDTAKAFLEDPQATKLSLFVVAHWSLGVVTVGFLSLMTLVYLFDRVVLLIRVVQRMCGVQEEKLLLAEWSKPNTEQPAPETP